MKPGKRKYLLTLLLVLVLLLLVSLVGVDYRVMGHFEGLFVIRQENGKRIILSDDIMLGERPRLLMHLSIEPLVDLMMRKRHLPGEQYLDYEFVTADGSGFVRDMLPGGRELRTCFSRFLDDDGGVVKGLVIGGGLPFLEGAHHGYNHDDTGMAYYDGATWHHLWCNANEVIVLRDGDDHKAVPHDWQFLESKILDAGDKYVIFRSSHRVSYRSTSINFRRYFLFQAGKPYVVLVQKVTNGGSHPARYFWVYSDEPWVGSYGSSVGNVGWSAGRFHYYEGRVDTNRTTFAGIADMGNPLAGEKPDKHTGLANFIEWLPERPPTFIYFANQIGRYADEKQRVPLTSPANRCIALEWWPETLMPGQEQVYGLAIGLAGKGTDGKPVKPQLHIDEGLMRKIVEDR